MRSALVAALVLPVFLAGCSSSTSVTSTPTPVAPRVISGSVQSGLQPIVAAHVYLFAANITGYGQPSVSLLNATSTGTSDSIGPYVLTDATGNFSIAGDYSCTTNSQVYLYALGGNPGTGTNAAAGELAILGSCPAAGNFLTAVPTVTVNEVTTIAAAFALAGFMTDPTHVSSSGTPLAQTGIANAFLNAGNLASVATGQALAMIPSGNATAPQTTVNVLADILAACVNSTGPSSSSCSSLFSLARSSGASGTTPSDTAGAAINIAHNPAANVSALYSLIATNAPFTPLPLQGPFEYSLGLLFRTSGLGSPGPLAIDASGSVWLASAATNSVVKVSSSGAILSGASGFTDSSLVKPNSVALDDSGNVWLTSAAGGGNVVEFSNAGVILSGATGYNGGGLTSPRQIAIDGAGSAWITTQSGAIIKLSASGAVLSGGAGFTTSGMQRSNAIMVDASSNVWVSVLTGYAILFKLSNAGSFLSGTSGYAIPGVANASYLASDSLGNVWSTSTQIVKVSNTGTPLLAISADGPQSIAIDGVGNVWTANISDTTVGGLSNSGSKISGTFGYNGGVLTNPLFLAVDGSGDIWVVNETFGNTGSGLSELIGVAAPVVTPLATGVKNNALGTRP